jgi:hypothetical protein
MSTSSAETYGKAVGIEETWLPDVVVPNYAYLPTEALTYPKRVLNEVTGKFETEMFAEMFRELDRLCAELYVPRARVARLWQCPQCGRLFVPKRYDLKLCGDRACVRKLRAACAAKRLRRAA